MCSARFSPDKDDIGVVDSNLFEYWNYTCLSFRWTWDLCRSYCSFCAYNWLLGCPVPLVKYWKLKNGVRERVPNDRVKYLHNSNYIDDSPHDGVHFFSTKKWHIMFHLISPINIFRINRHEDLYFHYHNSCYRNRCNTNDNVWGDIIIKKTAILCSYNTSCLIIEII
jgi:hypothetical protein